MPIRTNCEYIYNRLSYVGIQKRQSLLVAHSVNALWCGMEFNMSMMVKITEECMSFIVAAGHHYNKR